eukprot:1145883-Pelagomonas_calceolata.AAC.2
MLLQVFMLNDLLLQLLISQSVELSQADRTLLWKEKTTCTQSKSGRARPHHTDQEEEKAQKSTPASWPPPWDLRHDCQAGPVQQARDPLLSPKHAGQHHSKGPLFPIRDNRDWPNWPNWPGEVITEICRPMLKALQGHRMEGASP